MRSLMAALALCVALPAWAKPLTPAQQAQLETNLARGDLLYAYDQAAWHVTDAALKLLPKNAGQYLKGYIVTPAPGGYRTTFYGGERGNYFRGYTGIWTGREVRDEQLFAIDGSAPATPVSPEEARLIEAKAIALASPPSDLFICSKNSPNTAVIPGSSPADPVSVYVLSSTTEPGVLHLGGHARIDVRDGRVSAHRNFTRGCLPFDQKRAGVPEGGKAEAFFITHSLDPLPTEIHAFSLHYLPVPLAVAATETDLIFFLSLKGGRTSADISDMPAAKR